jgi:hypothetical protein
MMQNSRQEARDLYSKLTGRANHTDTVGVLPNQSGQKLNLRQDRRIFASGNETSPNPRFPK